MKLIIFILLLYLFSNANSQSSSKKCYYGGYDFGHLANSTSYSSTDSNYQYTFYFNICDISSKCNTLSNGNIVACQAKNGGSYPPTSIGLIGQGSFSSSEDGVLLNYKTISNPCSDATFRNFNIYLIPSKNDQITISQVFEEKKCTYGVRFTYPINNSGSSSSSGHNNSSIVCEKVANGILVESESGIICSGNGPIKCYGGDVDNNSICFSEKLNNTVSCGTSNKDKSKMVCYGKSIECISNGISCKIVSNDNKLYINNK